MSDLTTKEIGQMIYFVRGHRVMLDRDLAELYAVPTKQLNLAVRRNRKRFPEDFLFQLSFEEFESLRFQFETSKKPGSGGRRYLPFAFTEHGVTMVASVLKSERAIKVNVAIVRAFVQLRSLLDTHRDLAEQLNRLEKKYDQQFKIVFDAIRQLMSSGVPSQKRIKGLGDN